MEIKTPKCTLESDAEYLENVKKRVNAMLDDAIKVLNGDGFNALLEAMERVEIAKKATSNAFDYLVHEIERTIKYDN